MDVIAEELWHHALICYALTGTARVKLDERVKLLLDADRSRLDKYYKTEQIYVQIAADSYFKGIYNINNKLSNLLILWGLARNYKGDENVAKQAAKQFLAKLAQLKLSENKKKNPFTNWKCVDIVLYLYPHRTPKLRFAPVNLPKFKFK